MNGAPFQPAYGAAHESGRSMPVHEGPCSSLTSAALAANAALSQLNLACHFLDRQIDARAERFEEEGGFAEPQYRVRTARRRNP